MSRGVVLALALLLVGFAIVVNSKGSSKYSKEKNRLKEETLRGGSFDDQERGSVNRKSSGHFRVARLDGIWERAKKQLTVDDQRDIFEELLDLDEDEITLKRLRHDGGDKNGDLTAKLRDKLHDILERYGLLTPVHDKSRASPEQIAKSKRDAKLAAVDLLFSDKKLNKLWAKAQKAGFSVAELRTLKTEFDHHQQKLDEYREVGGELGGALQQDKANESSQEESPDQLASGSEKVPSEDILKLDSGIKEIVKNYGRLKAKVNKNSFEPDSGEFEEVRVEELWHQALQAGFDREELLSLREELVHFERKINKLKNFREANAEAAGSKIAGNVQAKAGERSDEHVDLEQKVKHYAVKVENIQNDIERRINSRHNEL
ncbi:putative Alpha-2-macroglobulin receptor-associated protein [Hypsibius exemplaris]|uniref:Alpha-2-macroglobulin receptor-associated protein n=1 Tax=Hypsibius exemplaris TaxID=2072580 RepID=A0A1W0X4H1_HYPEX|nr:putative Alpha-2-macroglobulin receptor-associated protein [Hypsibius exemplaris]